MTSNQRTYRDLVDRASTERGRLAEIAALEKDKITPEVRAEAKKIQDGTSDLEMQIRAARAVLDADEARGAITKDADPNLDPEKREKAELRAKVLLTNYFQSAARGKAVVGVEAEYNAACGVTGEAEVPFELWEPTAEERAAAEKRAVAAVPTTVGVNYDTLQPYIFSRSIAPRLGIEMPRVPSGTYATGTISTPQSAAAYAESAVVAGVAGAITVGTTTPHRVSSRLELTLESIAEIGAENFESILRENVMLAMSDQLDDFAINGSGATANPGGLLNALSNPTAKTAVADFDDFVEAFADNVDGLWAETIAQIGIVVGVDTYKLSAKTWRDKLYGAASVSEANARAATTSGETFAEWAARCCGAWWTNSRMPSAASDNQAGVLYRMGRGGLRTAVMPTWGSLAIDDVYSGAARGERYYNVHALVGDVLLVQPDAYEEVTFHLA